MTGRPSRPHHQGTYTVRSRFVRAVANANADTRCARCGEPARPGDPWVAGHVNDGEIEGQLRAEHRSCNSSAGAEHGNRLREPRSEQWY